MSFYKKIEGYKTTLESDLVLDKTPKEGSFNVVTSDGVAKAIGDASEPLDTRLTAVEECIPDTAGDNNKLVTQSALDAAEAGWQAGYTPKGDASVSTLNGLTGQSNGDTYILTDSGTLTDGSLAVSAGDSVAWDDANSKWYKVSQYALEQFGTNEIHKLSTTATESDLVAGNYLALDGSAGTKKLPAEYVAKRSVQDKLLDDNENGNLGVYSIDEDKEAEFVSGGFNASNGDVTPSPSGTRAVCETFFEISKSGASIVITSQSGCYFLYYSNNDESDFLGSSGGWVDVKNGVVITEAIAGAKYVRFGLYSPTATAIVKEERDATGLNKDVEEMKPQVANLVSIVGNHSDVENVSVTMVAGAFNVNNGDFTPSESGNRSGCETFFEIPTDGRKVVLSSASNGCIFFYSNNTEASFISNSGVWTNLNTYDIVDSAPATAKYFRIMGYSSTQSVSMSLVLDATGLCKDVEDLQTIAQELGVFGNDIIFVEPNGRGSYTTIEDALANAGDTPSKHVTIIVMAGTYYPAPKLGTPIYQEGNRNLSLIGVDKNSCILVDDIGYYRYQDDVDTAPLRLSGNVLIKNLTIKSLSTNYATAKAEYGWTSTTNQRAYCIHTDFSKTDGDVTEINNCKLVNDHFCCIGFGLRKESLLRIVDVEMETTANGAESGGFQNYGTLYGHLVAGMAGLNQDLEVIRCQIMNDVATQAINIMDPNYNGTSTCHYKLIGNAVKTTDLSQSLVVSSYTNPDSSQRIFKSDLSFGNQATVMNA